MMYTFYASDGIHERTAETNTEEQSGLLLCKGRQLRMSQLLASRPDYSSKGIRLHQLQRGKSTLTEQILSGPCPNDMQPRDIYRTVDDGPCRDGRRIRL